MCILPTLVLTKQVHRVSVLPLSHLVWHPRYDYLIHRQYSGNEMDLQGIFSIVCIKGVLPRLHQRLRNFQAPHRRAATIRLIRPWAH